MGTEHVFFNSSIVKIISNNYPKYDLCFWGEKEHCRLVKEELSEMPSIIFHNLPIIDHSKLKIFISDLWSSIILVCILFKSAKNDKIILLNRLPITLLIYNVFNIFLKRSTMSVLHGELESIVNSNVRGMTKYYYELFLMSYAISNSLISYLVLGESIRQNIRNLNFGKGRLITIDHPYDYGNYEPINCINFQSLKIGIIGAAMLRKNSQLIFDLAFQTHQKSNNKKVEFVVIGMMDKQVEAFDNGEVVANFVNRRLSKEDYLEAIQTLDYSLLFYDKNINIALASGSFFDCIKFLKPIISLSGNPFVDYYFERFGNIGYKFHTIEEMSSFISDIVDDHCFKKEYQVQLKNLRRARKELSIDKISEQLEKQMRL